MHNWKIGNYLKYLAHDKVKFFVGISFIQYFKYATEEFYSKLCEEKYLWKKKFFSCFYIFLAAPNEIETYVELMQSSTFDNCICSYNIKFKVSYYKISKNFA